MIKKYKNNNKNNNNKNNNNKNNNTKNNNTKNNNNKTTATTLRRHVMIFKLLVGKFIMVVVTLCCKFMIKLMT